MEFVTLNGIYRGYLQTTDQATFPETAAWPDDNIEAADVVAEILGVTYGGTKTVTKQTDIGLHLITIDCAGVEAGTLIELSGEYYIDLIRYAWFEQLFVGINSSSIDDTSSIITAFKADADFGTAGLLLDAAAAAAQTNIDADGFNLQGAMRLMLSAMAGKVTATGTSFVARAADDSKDRITATTTLDGDRTAVTLDATP